MSTLGYHISLLIKLSRNDAKKSVADKNHCRNCIRISSHLVTADPSRDTTNLHMHRVSYVFDQVEYAAYTRRHTDNDKSN
jgi:hypothetical protein